MIPDDVKLWSADGGFTPLGGGAALLMPCALISVCSQSASAFNTVCVNEPLFGNKVLVMGIVSTA